MRELKLYPIYYEGKKYTEEECNDIFKAFYTCIEAYNHDVGVYVSEGMWIGPDGETKHW